MNVAVIGQGYVGLPIAISAAENGHQVFGFDIDYKKIAKLKLGISESPEVKSNKIIELQANGKIHFVSDISNLTNSDIFIIAVPTPLDSKHKPDLNFLNHACSLISKVIKPNCLVINESTSFIGTLRHLIKPTIDSLSKLDNIDYAVAPERIDPGNKLWNVRNTPRVIGGLSRDAVMRAVNFYNSFCENINPVSQAEVAEAAKLFENTFRQVNIALVNEFSEISSQLNFSANEAISAAATKSFGFMPFFPGIGVGGHCIPVDPSYLTYSAEQAGADSPLINLANEINLRAPIRIANKIEVKLSGTLIGKEIQLVGITYKPNISDLRESPALILIQELRSRGAIVSWFDPLIEIYNGEKSQPLKSSIDLGLIVTPHNGIDYSIWKNSKTEVIDLSANQMNFGWSKFL